MEEQKNTDQDQIAADAAGVSVDGGAQAPADVAQDPTDAANAEAFIESLLGTEEPSPEGDSNGEEGSDLDDADDNADASADDGDQDDLGDLEGSLDAPTTTDGSADDDDDDCAGCLG